VEKFCDAYQVQPEQLIEYELPADRGPILFEPYENRKEIKEAHYHEWLVDLDEISALCSQLEQFAQARKYKRILEQHHLDKLLKKIRNENYLFTTDEIYAIESLASKAKFDPFPRGDSHKKTGRPHQDSEMHIAWELSCIYKHKIGTQKGKTNWKKVIAMLDLFSKKYPFLKALTTNPEVLRKNIKTFKKRYEYTEESSRLKQSQKKALERITALTEVL